MKRWKVKVVKGYTGKDRIWAKREYPIGSVMLGSEWWNWESFLCLEDHNPATFRIHGGLNLVDAGKIRSGYTYIWEHQDTKARYPMFHTELMEIMQSCGVAEGGFIYGTFEVVKRGTSFGIKLIEEK